MTDLFYGPMNVHQAAASLAGRFELDARLYCGTRESLAQLVSHESLSDVVKAVMGDGTLKPFHLKRFPVRQRRPLRAEPWHASRGRTTMTSRSADRPAKLLAGD